MLIDQQKGENKGVAFPWNVYLTFHSPNAIKWLLRDWGLGDWTYAAIPSDREEIVFD